MVPTTGERFAASIASHYRSRRWAMLNATFPELADMRVLDIGGEIRGWSDAPVIPAEVVMLNTTIAVHMESDTPWAARLVGDGCAPGDVLHGERFDLVYCNSVIEHVGGHLRRIGLADTIHRAAPCHWVQTPYRYFPVEPHAHAPSLQFLPLWLQARLLRRWPLGTMGTVYRDWPHTEVGEDVYPVNGLRDLARLPKHHAVRGALSIELLSRTELQWLFPRSRIVAERAMGLPKSLIAIAAP